jgi:hypothetical protein
MKIVVRLIILIVLSFQNSYAQEGFRIGPMGSFLLSKPNVLDTLPSEFGFRFKSGANIGVSMYYGFTPNFGITLNGLFTSKGYRIFNDSNQNGNELKHNISYIEIPVYINFRQRLHTNSFLRETIGVAFSTQVSASSNETINDNGSFRIVETSTKTMTPMLDVGIELGNEKKSGNLFLFGVHYKYAFSNNTNLGIYNNKTSTAPYFNLGFKGNYIGISLSYLFNLNNLKKEEEFFY